MSYVPPYRRQPAVPRPILNNVVPSNALDYSALLKNKKKRLPETENTETMLLRKGWVKLTKYGIVDGLTDEERRLEKEEEEQRKQTLHMKQWFENIERIRIRRLREDNPMISNADLMRRLREEEYDDSYDNMTPPPYEETAEEEDNY
jgi:hypothetical protein